MAAIAEIGTFAYMGFLALLFTYKLVAGRKSRKLRKRVGWYTR